MRAASLALRLSALTLVLFVCFAFASGVVGFVTPQTPQPDGSAALRLVVVCFLEAAMIANLVLRSSWRGWRLVVAVFVVFYGVTTFMPQIESAVFLTRLPPGTVPRLFLMGAVIGAPFSLLAVPILGRTRAGGLDTRSNARPQMSGSEWAWKLGIIALAYVVLYFTFGYFIAWQNPALREYYGGVDNGFISQMGTVLRDTPWLLPIQILRSLCWVAIAVLVIKMLRGGWLEAALTIALLFSVLMNAQLLLPNPYMPDTVRMSHLVETASSNFLFGMFVGWLLLSRRSYPLVAAAESAG